MPTIHIRSSPMSTPRRREIAVRMTRWLTDRDVQPSHVIVRFSDVPPTTVFSGGMPTEAMGPASDGLQQAWVVCSVSPRRGDSFRAELAAEIAGVLGATERTSFLYIEFRSTEPADVYLAHQGAVRRADETSPAYRERSLK